MSPAIYETHTLSTAVNLTDKGANKLNKRAQRALGRSPEEKVKSFILKTYILTL